MAEGARAPHEQPGRRAVVAAPKRPPPGGGEPLARRERQRLILPPELDEVAVRLFEVVADNLLALDELPAVLVEPVREASVEVGPDRLGKCVVGGVANQEVTEPVTVISCEWARSGRTSWWRTSAAIES